MKAPCSPPEASVMILTWLYRQSGWGSSAWLLCGYRFGYQWKQCRLSLRLWTAICISAKNKNPYQNAQMRTTKIFFNNHTHKYALGVVKGGGCCEPSTPMTRPSIPSPNQAIQPPPPLWTGHLHHPDQTVTYPMMHLMSPPQPTGQSEWHTHVKI